MRITRTVTTAAPVHRVFAFMSDFTTTTKWDPGTVLTTRISGDGGVGTVYANTSQFNGRQTELLYTVIDYRPDSLVQLRGENRTLTAIDTITCDATSDGGTRVTYDAHFTFKGLARLAVPFLGGAFRKLGDEAEVGMRKALGALANNGEAHA